jgi:hypothetical protein
MAAPSTSGRGRAALAVLVGAYVLIDLLGSIRTSPIRPPLPRGVGPPAWSATVARWFGLERLTAGWVDMATMIVLGLLVAAFVVLVAEAVRRRVGLAAVAVAAAVSIASAVAGPVVLSRDVSSYAAYGRIAAVDHTNPYVATPAAFPGDPFTPAVSGDWIQSRSVYGPAFTVLSAAVAGPTRGSPAATILAFKVLAGVAVAGATWCAAAVARRRDPRLMPLVVALVGVNPVIVVHTVGGGHNDALVGLGLAGAAFATAGGRRSAVGGRALLVTAVLTLTALVKIVAAIPLVMFVLWSMMLAPSGRERARAAVAHLSVVALLCAGLTAIYGTPAIRALADLASRTGWASAARLVRRGLEAIGGGSSSALRTVIALLFAAAFLAVLWPLVRDRPGRGPEGGTDAPARWGTALLGAALAGPYLLPWYAAWFAPLIGLARDRVVLWIGVAACCVLTLTGVPAEPGTDPAAYRDGLLGVHYVAAPLVLALLAALVVRSVRSLTGASAVRQADPELPIAAKGTV